MVYDITDAKEIKKLLDNNDIDTIDVKVQVFVKYLRTDPDKFVLLYGKIVDNFLKGDFHILSSENYEI